MKYNRRMLSFVVMVICLALANCHPQPPTAELVGQVFVVTKAGESIKLGSVDVSAISEPDVTRFYQQKMAAFDGEKASLEQQAKEAEQRKKIADAKKRIAGLDNESAYHEWNTARLSDWLHYYAVRSFPTAEWYFDGIPEGVSKTITDADGRFSLTVPSKGRYALA